MPGQNFCRCRRHRPAIGTPETTNWRPRPDDGKAARFPLGIDDAAFQKEINVMRHYRDKFLANLDSDGVMNIPALDMAKKAVWPYHAHIVQREAQPGDLSGLPVELDACYAQCEDEARAIYERNA